MSDLRCLLPRSVSRDSAFVSALHAQLEERIREEVREALRERTDDWRLEERLARLDELVAEQEQGLHGRRETVW